MKIKKILFSTVISDLYGKDKYKSHIKVDNEYWYFFDTNTEAYKVTQKHWNKIKITYIRSGCLFYILPDTLEVKEDFCPINCFMTSQFVLAELDPIKDLKDLVDDINSEAAKIKYCFDDEHTVIKNWPNERETEISKEELSKYRNSEQIMIMMLGV